MVGDTVADDIDGAHAIGMQAVLLDRTERYPDRRDRIESLRALPAALGLD
jgi:FMN phosphatase YigB (HAD superfamily)